MLNLFSLIHRYLNIVNPQNAVAVLDLAYRLRITYYDASYVVTASELGLPLVTDDVELRRRLKSNTNIVVEVLSKEVEAISSNEYIARKRHPFET